MSVTVSAAGPMIPYSSLSLVPILCLPLSLFEFPIPALLLSHSPSHPASIPVSSLSLPSHLLLHHTSAQLPFHLYLNLSIPIFIPIPISISICTLSLWKHMQPVHPRLHSLLEVTFKWKHTLPSPSQCADLLLRMIIPYLQQKQGEVHIFYLASGQVHCVTFPAVSVRRPAPKVMVWC